MVGHVLIMQKSLGSILGHNNQPTKRKLEAWWHVIIIPPLGNQDLLILCRSTTPEHRQMCVSMRCVHLSMMHRRPEGSTGSLELELEALVNCPT